MYELTDPTPARIAADLTPDLDRPGLWGWFRPARRLEAQCRELPGRTRADRWLAGYLWATAVAAILVVPCSYIGGLLVVPAILSAWVLFAPVWIAVEAADLITASSAPLAYVAQWHEVFWLVLLPGIFGVAGCAFLLHRSERSFGCMLLTALTAIDVIGGMGFSLSVRSPGQGPW